MVSAVCQALFEGEEEFFLFFLVGPFDVGNHLELGGLPTGFGSLAEPAGGLNRLDVGGSPETSGLPLGGRGTAEQDFVEHEVYLLHQGSCPLLLYTLYHENPALSSTLQTLNMGFRIALDLLCASFSIINFLTQS